MTKEEILKRLGKNGWRSFKYALAKNRIIFKRKNGELFDITGFVSTEPILSKRLLKYKTVIEFKWDNCKFSIENLLTAKKLEDLFERSIPEKAAILAVLGFGPEWLHKSDKQESKG